MADLGVIGRSPGLWRATKYARTIAPQLISYTEIPYTTVSNPMVTGASVSWLAGDTIVVIAGAENVGTINVPTTTTAPTTLPGTPDTAPPSTTTTLGPAPSDPCSQ